MSMPSQNNVEDALMSRFRMIILRGLAVLMGFVSLFFVFYTARLLYVTHGLTVIRAGGNGTYMGAVAFPLFALLFGFGAWRCVKSTRRVGS